MDQITFDLNAPPQVVMLTPEYAQQILSICAYPHQRTVRQTWVLELSEIIKAGQFATTMVTIAACPALDAVYLVDGYHRLSAIVQAEMPACVLVNVVTCKSMKEVGELYSRLDRGLPRTVADGLIARNMPALTDVPISTLRQAIAAYNVMKGGFRKDPTVTRRRGSDEKIEHLNEWLPELRLYVDTIACAPRTIYRRLCTSPIMAVGLVLMRHQKDKAYTFFKGVAMMDNLQIDSPQYAMLTKVLASDVGVRKIGTATMSRCVAACWNAYYEGRSLAYVRAGDITKPIIILGTPYTSYNAKTKTVAELAKIP